MLSFNHKIYVNLLRESSELARKYKIDCGLVTGEETKEVIEDIPQETKEVSRDELKEKLNNAGIQFFNGAKTEKLVELCIENNLL